MKWSEHPNAKKWLTPPTIEQIDAVVKASGVSELQFERFHDIYPGCIKKVRFGGYRIPVQYWHLFLEDTKSMVPNLVPKSVSKIVPIKKQAPKIKKDSRLSELL